MKSMIVNFNILKKKVKKKYEIKFLIESNID